jgi:hypothetical protein
MTKGGEGHPSLSPFALLVVDGSFGVLQKLNRLAVIHIGRDTGEMGGLLR